jgi:hypothetical protein
MVIFYKFSLISEILKREYLTEYYIFKKEFHQMENIHHKLKRWSGMVFLKYYMVTGSKTFDI